MFQCLSEFCANDDRVLLLLLLLLMLQMECPYIQELSDTCAYYTCLVWVLLWAFGFGFGVCVWFWFCCGRLVLVLLCAFDVGCAVCV